MAQLVAASSRSMQITPNLARSRSSIKGVHAAPAGAPISGPSPGVGLARSEASGAR